MPRRSKVMALPAEVRRRLEQLLIERGFSGYSELADWLTEQGHPISHAAVHRHGAELERRIEQVKVATEAAEAFVAAVPDDTGAMADAGLRLAQERIFQVFLAAEGGNLKELAAAGRALAEMSRAGTAIRQERRKALSEAAGRAGKEMRRQGLSREGAAAIRKAIQGGE